MPSPELSFDGLSNYDNIDAYNLLILPPDPIGDVGPNHYVQAVNALLRVFSKAGEPLSPPLRFSDIYAPLNTQCSQRNDGTPSVLYDPLADRWIISTYCSNFPPFKQMIAVSRSGDPLGSYYLYEFVMPNFRLNDHAKLAVWHDAYYMSTDEFVGPDYMGAGLFAFDRGRMLAGAPDAGYIYFHIPSSSPERKGGLLPADLDGMTAPPARSPNIFAGYSATEYGDAQDAIRLFDFHADFRQPELSTFIERPESPIIVAAFDPTSSEGRADIVQPPPGEPLDSLSDRLMYRVAYRNFGTHESLVINQTVRVSVPGEQYRAGVRLYEFRSTAGQFGVHEQSTIGENTSSRWVASAAQDRLGNLAVGYSFTNDDKQPSIIYTGRLATDPPGTVRTEATLVRGTGVQKAFGWRWGNYTGMSVDPDDDCTFWMTNEYYTLESQNFSDFTWLTQIGAFRFPECTPAPRGRVSIKVVNAATGLPLQSSDVSLFPDADTSAVPFTRRTQSRGVTDTMLIPPGIYSVRAELHGYAPATITVNVPDDRTSAISAEIRLAPVPVIEFGSAHLAAGSCRLNRSPEPGETVTFDVSVKNTGALPAQNLIARIVPNTSVNSPGPQQVFGTLAPGAAATRPFTFTVAAGLSCGEQALLELQLFDGTAAIGSMQIPLQTGELNYAMRENFDGTSSARLPADWTSSVTGEQRPWRASARRRMSLLNSAFSPTVNQVGISDLVSAPFSVTAEDAVLAFQNWYDLETTFLRNRLYDGSVLEIRTNGGPWQDIIEAGGAFNSGGYDGTIDSCCQNPLGGRAGWSGRSGIGQTPVFVTTSIRLPASARGGKSQLRWRVATDIGGSREGQYIDNLTITDGYSCSCGK